MNAVLTRLNLTQVPWRTMAAPIVILMILMMMFCNMNIYGKEVMYMMGMLIYARRQSPG